MPLKSHILKKPCFQFISEVNDITSDYFRNVDLHFFGHGIVYPDGKFTILNSKHGWGEDIFAEKRLPPIGFTIYNQIQDAVLFPNMEKGAPLGWTDQTAQESKERFNILHPMIITRKYQEYYEIFILDLHEPNTYEIYLNHFDIFEGFIHFYKEKAKKLIQIAHQNPFEVEAPYLIQPHSFSPSHTLNVPFLTRYYLRHKNTDAELSGKEYECLSFISHGNSLKTIANKLNLSLRTVETYLERIKRKLNVVSRQEMIKIYWDNRLV